MIGNQRVQIENEEGENKVHSSPRPAGTTTVFVGAGDDAENGVGEGNRLMFSLAADTPFQTIDLVFNETVHVKDGYMIARGAPFGAYLDVDIVHPETGKVGMFCRKVPILANGWFPLNSEDRSDLPAGIILRVTVYNSTGADGEDEAVAFQMAGRIELFRAHTV